MNELITAGFELLTIGMVIVFIFLAVLVLAVNMLRLFVQQFFPAQQSNQAVTGSVGLADNSNIIAAISAAVTQYRNKHSK